MINGTVFEGIKSNLCQIYCTVFEELNCLKTKKELLVA